MRRIEIVVEPNGETRLETKGFAGGECQQASRFLEAALGKRSQESLTAEFHQRTTTSQALQERQ